MNNEFEIKNLVREKYAAIAEQSQLQNATSCCGATSTCSGQEVYNIMADDYTTLDGYNPDADLGLGCGLPTEFAKIKLGNTVIDLGSGAGNDAFIARRMVGENGKVLGIDFTEAMISKARENAEKLKFNNTEHSILKDQLNNNVKSDEKIEKLFQSLKDINAKLWVIEDDKRKCEKEKDFTEKFIKLSRDVHFLNDDRAKIKLEINNHTGSKIKEIKEYTSY